MRILVVEDDFTSRRLLCRFLETYGECDVAVNGHEAISAVASAIKNKEHYGLICLDIMMPEMDGQETLNNIRALEKADGRCVGQGSRIIMTSALDDHGNVRQAFKSLADGYLVKPISREKLSTTLKDLDIPIEIPL